MTPQEIGQVLALCAAFDQRTTGPSDVVAWFEVIGDLTYADASRAVKDHYRVNRERITVADIRERVVAMRRARLVNVEDIDLVGDVDPDDPQWHRILQGRRQALMDGMPLEQAKAIPARSAVLAISGAR